MTQTRTDSWTEENDLLLAETVLRHIREGSTQLRAFDEVAEKLNRTPAACGFRWSSTLRDNYQTAVDIAKKARIAFITSRNKSKKTKDVIIQKTEQISEPKKQLKRQQDVETNQSSEFFALLKGHLQEFEGLKQRLKEANATIQKLENENKEMKERLSSVNEEKKEIEEDYKVLTEILGRARKLAENESSLKYNLG